MVRRSACSFKPGALRVARCNHELLGILLDVGQERGLGTAWDRSSGVVLSRFDCGPDFTALPERRWTNYFLALGNSSRSFRSDTCGCVGLCAVCNAQGAGSDAN